MSEVTLHRGRAVHEVVDRDGGKRLKDHEKHNARLKRLVADQQPLRLPNGVVGPWKNYALSIARK